MSSISSSRSLKSSVPTSNVQHRIKHRMVKLKNSEQNILSSLSPANKLLGMTKSNKKISGSFDSGLKLNFDVNKCNSPDKLTKLPANDKAIG